MAAGDIHVVPRYRWALDVFPDEPEACRYAYSRRIVRGRKLNPVGRSAAAPARGETMQRLFIGVLALGYSGAGDGTRLHNFGGRCRELPGAWNEGAGQEAARGWEVPVSWMMGS